ncbi:MAG: flagellar protein FlaG [Moraxella osloensis]|nr:flagellar protein FlaG [Moraxella osloensis]MBD3777032.1 flagellar protein FlaG [Thiotrichales bacterium]MBD3793953.1 flagellar protein FlaG [Campylobacterales bacterium]
MTELNVMQPQRLENNLLSPGIKRVASLPDASDIAVNDAVKNQQAGKEVNLPISSGVLQKNDQTQNSLNDEDGSVDGAVEQLNQQLERLKNYLRFEKDEEADRMVIFIKNAETGEVIRQIPSQEFLTISKNISRYLEMRQQSPQSVAMPIGLITNEKA